MKIEVDISDLSNSKSCDRTICVRIPVSDYEKLKKFHGNVSHVVRGLIIQFINQMKTNKNWTKK